MCELYKTIKIKVKEELVTTSQWGAYWYEKHKGETFDARVPNNEEMKPIRGCVEQINSDMVFMITEGEYKGRGIYRDDCIVL